MKVPSTIQAPDGNPVQVEIVRRYRSPINGSEQMDVRLMDSNVVFRCVPAEWEKKEAPAPATDQPPDLDPRMVCPHEWVVNP